MPNASIVLASAYAQTSHPMSMSVTANPAAPAPFDRDGSNDPLQPTPLTTSSMGVWISGQVSAVDPDYFYLTAPSGMRFKSLTLESYRSVDPIAFIAIQIGSQFTAGYDTTKMLFGRHIGAGDVNKNLLDGLMDKAQEGIVIWVNQTGALTDYIISAQFEVAQGKNIYGTFKSESIKGTDAPERIFAVGGDDTIQGGLRDDTIDGGEGLDTAVFSNRRESYSISILETNTVSVRFEGPIIAIYPPPPTDGTDTLIHMERIQFSDRSVAMDLDSSAGDAARLLAAVFGKDAVKNPTYAGIAISLFDQGLSKDQVSQVALNAVFGANAKSKDVVSLIWKNLTGSTIDDKNLAELSGLIDSKAITAAQLTTKAADLELTAQLTDLVGLSKTGWEYIPYGG